MADCDERTVAAAVLIISELVTNAVVHAETLIEVELVRQDNTVRGAVSDGSKQPPALLDHGPWDDRGRGLQVVDSLADNWGVVELPHGKTVWFTVRCHAC